MAGPNDTTGAQGGFTPPPPPDQDTTPDAGADQTDQLGTDVDPAAQATPPEAAGFDPNTSLPTQPQFYTNSTSQSSSGGYTDIGAIPGIERASGLDLLGQNLAANKTQTEADAADANAALDTNAATQKTADLASADVQRQRQEAAYQANKAWDAGMQDIAAQQSQISAVAAAHAKMAEAKFSQDIAAIQHMEINPTAGQGAAYNTMSGIALFAQGFLSAKYNVSVDAQGVLNSWVDRVTQMQQQQLARGEKLADADQQMWTMARTDALDRQDELNRVSALLAARAQAQLAMAGNMLAGPAAAADIQQKSAAIDVSVAAGKAAVAATRAGHVTSIMNQQLDVAKTTLDAAKVQHSQSSSLGTDQVHAGAAPSEGLTVFDSDPTKPEGSNDRPAAVIKPTLINNPNAQKAVALANTQRTINSQLKGIMQMARDGLAYPGGFSKWAGGHAAVISGLQSGLTYLMRKADQLEAGKGEDVNKLVTALSGGDVSNVTPDGLTTLARLASHAGMVGIDEVNHQLSPYAVGRPHFSPEDRAIFQAGFDHTAAKDSPSDAAYGILTGGKLHDKSPESPDGPRDSAWLKTADGKQAVEQWNSDSMTGGNGELVQAGKAPPFMSLIDRIGEDAKNGDAGAVDHLKAVVTQYYGTPEGNYALKALNDAGATATEQVEPVDTIDQVDTGGASTSRDKAPPK